MSNCFDFREGFLPLLISVPHDGHELPRDIALRMTDAGRAIPDTDWHVNRLYDFAARMGAYVISANFSRYVVDLNRSSDDAALYRGQVSTGLCPEKTFAGDRIYNGDAGVSAEEKTARVEKYWQPYHDKLADALCDIKTAHGSALLWDAHSIPGEVSLLFEGQLPDLNIGSNGGKSCAGEIEKAVARVATQSAFSCVVNGRFQGGFITRHYGSPGENVHAIQLELSQRCYMDEPSRRYDEVRAGQLAATIEGMLQAGLASVAPAA